MALPVFLALVVKKVLEVQTVPMATLLSSPTLSVTLVDKVFKVCQVPKVPPVSKVLEAPPVPQVPKVLVVDLVNPVKTA